MKSINLIPRDRLDARVRRRLMQIWLVILTSLVLVLAVGFSIVHVFFAPDNSGKLCQLNSLTNTIDESKAAEKSLQAIVSKSLGRLEANQVVVSQPDWSLLIAAIGNEVGDSIALRSIGIKPLQRGNAAGSQAATAASLGAEDTEEYLVQIAGMSAAQPDIMQFALRLEQIGLFESVRLLNTRREPYLQSDAVAFQIECDLGQAKAVIK